MNLCASVFCSDVEEEDDEARPESKKKRESLFGKVGGHRKIFHPFLMNFILHKVCHRYEVDASVFYVQLEAEEKTLAVNWRQVYFVFLVMISLFTDY